MPSRQSHGSGLFLGAALGLAALVMSLWLMLLTTAGGFLGGIVPPAACRPSGVVKAVVMRWAPCGNPASAAPVIPGPHAVLLPGGAAAAPRAAPASVRAVIAAGNQIAGSPYVYGGGHGVPLNTVAASYDCSSSVEHLLYGGGLLPATADMSSAGLMSWGRPGPGRWITIYANATHVFMYVAGLRWDTYNAGGPGDGSTGIGWHPLVRSDAGFVVRHPAGL